MQLLADTRRSVAAPYTDQDYGEGIAFKTVFCSDSGSLARVTPVWSFATFSSNAVFVLLYMNPHGTVSYAAPNKTSKTYFSSEMHWHASASGANQEVKTDVPRPTAALVCC